MAKRFYICLLSCLRSSRDGHESINCKALTLYTPAKAKRRNEQYTNIINFNNFRIYSEIFKLPNYSRLNAMPEQYKNSIDFNTWCTLMVREVFHIHNSLFISFGTYNNFVLFSFKKYGCNIRKLHAVVCWWLLKGKKQQHCGQTDTEPMQNETKIQSEICLESDKPSNVQT